MIKKAARKSKAREAPAVAIATDDASAATKDVPTKTAPAGEPDEEGQKAEETADDFWAEMIPIVRAWIRRLMNDNKEPPTENATDPKLDAMTRSREVAASSTLVKTLQDLDALARAREKRGKKNSTLDERKLMERFIRRMDELLSRGKPPSAYKPSAERKPDGG